MTTAKTRRLCAFDLETTGTDVTRDRIVTAAILHIDPSTGIIERKQWLADPGVDIPEQATAVHGITTEHARANGQDHDTVVQEVSDELHQAWGNGETIVVYNAAFDLSMLYVLSGGRFTIEGPVIDPLVLDRHFDTYRGGRRTLTAVAGHYGIFFDDAQAHAADYDALIAARVAWRMEAQRYQDQWPADDNDLMRVQMKAKASQFNKLRDYLAGMGKTIDGDAGWPIQHCAKEAAAALKAAS